MPEIKELLLVDGVVYEPIKEGSCSTCSLPKSSCDEYDCPYKIRSCIKSPLQLLDLREELIYDVDCDGKIAFRMSIKDSKPTALLAMNGRGDSIKAERIRIALNNRPINNSYRSEVSGDSGKTDNQ